MTQYVKAEGNLLECYETLNSKGFVIPDAEQFAEMRVADAKEKNARRKSAWKESEVCTNAAWVSNGIVYDGRNVLVTDSAHNPILKNIHDAIKAHSGGREFTLDNKTIEELRDLAKPNSEDARKTGVLHLTYSEDLPVDQLSNRQYSQFLFGKQAEPYGRLCKNAKIEVIPVHFLSERGAILLGKVFGKPFGASLLVRGLGNRSTLIPRNGDTFYSDIGGRVFGIPANVFGIPSKEGIEARVGAK